MDATDFLNPEHRDAAIKILFGSTGRFALASWLIGRADPIFHLSHYALETGRQVVSSGHLERFLQMGMVTRLNTSPPSLYQRLPSPLWRVYETALELLGDPVKAENDQMRSELLKMVARHSAVQD